MLRIGINKMCNQLKQGVSLSSKKYCISFIVAFTHKVDNLMLFFMREYKNRVEN